jgi:hypothetical protein
MPRRQASTDTTTESLHDWNGGGYKLPPHGIVFGNGPFGINIPSPSEYWEEVKRLANDPIKVTK